MRWHRRGQGRSTWIVGKAQLTSHDKKTYMARHLVHSSHQVLQGHTQEDTYQASARRREAHGPEECRLTRHLFKASRCVCKKQVSDEQDISPLWKTRHPLMSHCFLDGYSEIAASHFNIRCSVIFGRICFVLYSPVLDACFLGMQDTIPSSRSS